MFDTIIFKDQLSQIQNNMKKALRGELEKKIELSVIDELTSIYSKMVVRYDDDFKAGKSFPAQTRVMQHPEQDRVFYALEDLLKRMELDFSQKFVKDFTHGLDKEIEIGKIKISFLDGVRRSLNLAKS